MNSKVSGAVLVVIDKDLERETMLALLRQAGHQAWAVADVVSALTAIDTENPVDVVLCDLCLPDSTQNGVDLLRRWKRRQPSTRFLFVSGAFDVGQVVEAVKLGAEDYFTKPYNTSDLLRRVEECVAAMHENATRSLGDFDSPSGTPERDFKPLGHLTLEQLERLAIEHALRRAEGNRTRAANALGISVRTLQRKLKSWGAGASYAPELSSLNT